MSKFHKLYEFAKLLTYFLWQIFLTFWQLFQNAFWSPPEDATNSQRRTKNIFKARTERRNWTELNWHSLVLHLLLTNGQAVMHYSRHHLYNGVGGLRDCAHVRVSYWPMGSPCLPIGQFVEN